MQDDPMPDADASSRDAFSWGRFLDTVGHELRTPLTGILGYQELLEEGVYGEIDPRGQEAVRRIGSAGSELLSLLNAMIDFGRGADHLDLELEQVDTHSVALEAALSGRRLAEERAVAWSDDVADDLPVVRSDRHRLRRALFLAVLAAVRSAGDGEIVFTARADGGDAVVEIAGVPFGRLPDPDLDAVVLQAGDDEPERSLLRLALAVHTIHGLGGRSSIEPGDPGVLRLRFGHVDASPRAG